MCDLEWQICFCLSSQCSPRASLTSWGTTFKCPVRACGSAVGQLHTSSFIICAVIVCVSWLKKAALNDCILCLRYSTPHILVWLKWWFCRWRRRWRRTERLVPSAPPSRSTNPALDCGGRETKNREGFVVAALLRVGWAWRQPSRDWLFDLQESSALCRTVRSEVWAPRWLPLAANSLSFK